MFEKLSFAVYIYCQSRIGLFNSDKITKLCYFAVFAFETFKVLVIDHYSCYIVINKVKLAVMCLISLTYKLWIKLVFFKSVQVIPRFIRKDSLCIDGGVHYIPVHIPVVYTNVLYC